MAKDRKARELGHLTLGALGIVMGSVVDTMRAADVPNDLVHVYLDRLESGFAQFAKDNVGNPKAEYLIPEVVDKMIKEGSAKVKVLVSDDKWYGVTYQEDKPKVQEAFAMLVAENTYPSPLFN